MKSEKEQTMNRKIWWRKKGYGAIHLCDPEHANQLLNFACSSSEYEEADFILEQFWAEKEGLTDK